MLEKIVVLMVVGVIALMFFGNRLPQVMGDLGKGMKAFKDGMNEGSGEKPDSKRAVSKGRGPKKVAGKAKGSK